MKTNFDHCVTGVENKQGCGSGDPAVFFLLRPPVTAGIKALALLLLSCFFALGHWQSTIWTVLQVKDKMVAGPTSLAVYSAVDLQWLRLEGTL